MAAAIGGGVGGSVVFIVIIVLVVLFLVPRCRSEFKLPRKLQCCIPISISMYLVTVKCKRTENGSSTKSIFSEFVLRFNLYLRFIRYHKSELYWVYRRED